MSEKIGWEHPVVIDTEPVEGGLRTTIVAAGVLHELPPVTASQFVSVCEAFIPQEQRIEREEL